MTNKQLNKTERTEPMYVTWGRIRTAAHQLKTPRLIALVEKFNKDLSKAKVEENHFIDWNGIEGINRTVEF